MSIGTKGYKEMVFTSTYTAEQLNDAIDDLVECTATIEDTDEYGDFKGEIRITVEYIPEGACECTGLQHRSDCKHWVMPY